MIYFKDNNNNNSTNRIDILPMIDIIFAILSFLIISSLYLTRVDTLEVDLPKASNSIKQNKEFITISIDKFEKILINKEYIQIEDLKLRLINLITEKNNLIVLNADKNISHGYIIKIIDILKNIEGLKIAISTKSIN